MAEDDPTRDQPANGSELPEDDAPRSFAAGDDAWDETVDELPPVGHRGEKTEADRAQGIKTRRMTKDIISKRV